MGTKPGPITAQPLAVPGAGVAKPRRRRLSTDDHVRYFLPKPGSTPDKPELGREMPTEGEALIEAFKNGQPFFALTVLNAVTEVKGGGGPVIVKQPVVRS